MNVSKLKIDAFDKIIISELQKDARLSSADLAERVSLSTSPCWRRVKRLEDLKIIQGYHARIDYEKLGYAISAIVQITLSEKEIAHMDAFEQAVLGFEEVVTCQCISGTYDYQLTIIARDLNSFAEFMRRNINAFVGVKDVCTSFIMREVKAAVPASIHNSLRDQ